MNASFILEILVEEDSMRNFLAAILPRILPAAYRLGESCFVRSHEGKTDLKKSIRDKVRRYQNYPRPVKLLVIMDQNGGDCRALKAQLMQLVRRENAELPLLVRIACRELENWYLGDLPAVERLYPQSKAGRFKNRAKFRTPDKLNGADEMGKLSKEFRKGDCARRIGKHMTLRDNRSASFRCFVSGVQRFCRTDE